jgi:hypothetical protein
MEIDSRTAVLFAGVAVAVVTGLSAGVSMRPVLAQPSAPMQPVMISSVEASASPAGYWSGNGAVPTYVVGTDWLPHEPPVTTPVADAEVTPAEELAPPPLPYVDATYLPYVDATYQEAPPEPDTSYPSETGDILAGMHPAPAPEPPPAI